jgi:trans-aconitate 2-methyltransferase
MWDPTEYLRFADHRARPFGELLARIGDVEATSVVDLGCGPGNLTALLAQRWPHADVEGIDSSPEMVERARADYGATADGRVRFSLNDIRSWTPPAPVDVLISNATFQWVPGHLDLLARWVGTVRPGGWFAFGVPGNVEQPSHTELAAVCGLPRWRERLDGVELSQQWVAQPREYLERLVALGLDADVWETTYQQVLPGQDAVLRWVSGTALRPVLAVLDEQERADFTAEYGARLRRAYPRRWYGTVLAFRRIFAVARVAG